MLKASLVCYVKVNTIFFQKKRVYTLVDEITAVTRATWNPTLGDIRMPFEENNTFFTNQLIFD